MTGFNTDALVSTEWLADHLTAPDVRVVDASWYLPHEGLLGRDEYELHHIPGAVFFDIDEIADSDSELPHMLPESHKFSSRVRRLGLGDGVRMVIYDQRGIMSAPRVWWTFRYFGHNDVAVLDGGFPKWLAEGRPVEDGPGRNDERHFTARENSLMVRDKDQMESNLASQREQVLDARSRGRFEGSEPEPWPGRRSGRIPGSLNMPSTDLLDPDSQTMLEPEELKQRFIDAGVNMNKPVVTTCGSGITAAVLALGLHVAGHKDIALYDGAWTEWGLPGDTPVETGPTD